MALILGVAEARRWNELHHDITDLDSYQVCITGRIIYWQTDTTDMKGTFGIN